MRETEFEALLVDLGLGPDDVDKDLNGAALARVI